MFLSRMLKTKLLMEQQPNTETVEHGSGACLSLSPHLEAEAGEFKATMIYTASSRLARTVQCDPQLKDKNKTKNSQAEELRDPTLHWELLAADSSWEIYFPRGVRTPVLYLVYGHTPYTCVHTGSLTGLRELFLNNDKKI